MKLIEKIPFLSEGERIQLRTNCERARKSSNPTKRAQAIALLKALDAVGSTGVESSSAGSERTSRAFGNARNGRARPTLRPPVRRTLFRADPSYETTPGIREALAAIDAGAPVVLITGRAGTGKTTLIRYLKNRPGGETQVVIAPTGVAALNAEAQTIHSFLHFPFGVLDARNLPPGKQFGALYRRMTRLVIDEISMVRADMIDAIDARLRDIRKDQRPFGGVQIVMVGDFLQLPPVVQTDDAMLLEQLGYRTPYAFSAHVLEALDVTKVMLEQVYRQEERDFVDLLNAVRLGQDVERTIATLNALCHRPHRAGVVPLLLTGTRLAAERHNRRGLEAIAGLPSIFGASVEGKFDLSGERLPAPEHLELKPGARVMATRNDPERRYINGSLGTVTRVEDEHVLVRFDSTGLEHKIEPVTWSQIRQGWDETNRQVTAETIGSYKQIPLIHAWAITIHKAQGLTLDDVRIDLSTGAFAPGQAYVALSRVRSVAGLSLAVPLRPSDLKTDIDLINAQAIAGF